MKKTMEGCKEPIRQYKNLNRSPPMKKKKSKREM